MDTSIQAPRGTADVLPADSYRWHYVENKVKEICRRFGYREIRVPTFEYTELFQRGVGETTDVVGKEMYTMTDRSGRSITLRPEGTAGVVRSMLQHGVLNGTLPLRSYYLLSCFRYEKPQAGRYREFHQFGIELFGAATPDADTEVIKVAKSLLDSLGIINTKLEINSIGCKECRPKYHNALRSYFTAHENEFCETCRDRLVRNPLRILDCKSPICSEIAKDAPQIVNFLCDECENHFDGLKMQLSESGLHFTVNPQIVRGLDYYSRTVFEFIHEGAGAQGTICGGGRYDTLTEYLGGTPCPGIGFGMGLERILLVMENEGIVIPEPAGPDVFFAFIGDEAKKKARSLTFSLRQSGIYAMYDINARSLKAQMKYADKVSAKRSVVIGDGELKTLTAKLRDMNTKSESDVVLDAESLIAVLRA